MKDFDKILDVVASIIAGVLVGSWEASVGMGLITSLSSITLFIVLRLYSER